MRYADVQNHAGGVFVAPDVPVAESELWTQAKKLTTKWNREAGTNWMS